MRSNVAMMDMTTSSSMSVKAGRPRRPTLPVAIRGAIESGSGGIREHVVDVIARLGTLRRARKTPETPGPGSRHARIGEERVPWQPPEEVHRLQLRRGDI